MVRGLRLANAIDRIATGSNFQHEVIVLLCEIADMLEDMTYPMPITERIDAICEQRGIPDTVIDNKCVITAEEPKKPRTMAWEKEMIPKKRGRPFKNKL